MLGRAVCGEADEGDECDEEEGSLAHDGSLCGAESTRVPKLACMSGVDARSGLFMDASDALHWKQTLCAGGRHAGFPNDRRQGEFGSSFGSCHE